MVSTEERRSIADLIERLARTHPGIEREQIIAIVDTTHATFSSAKIRDFVPLFVERRIHVLLGEHDAAGAVRFG